MHNTERCFRFLKNYTQIVVFSKSFCPYCKKTKALFTSPPYGSVTSKAIHELDLLDYGPAVQTELLKMTGQKTVPSVWINGQHLGGNDDTQEAAKSGKLQEMLGKE